MPSKRLRSLDIGDELVIPVGIGHPAADDRYTVLLEEQAIGTADRLRRTSGEGARARSEAIWLEGSKEEINVVRYLFDIRQAGERLRQDRRIASAVATGGWDIGRDDEIGRVGTSEKGRKEGLRPTSAGYCAHRQASEEPNEKDDREVTAPPAADRGTEPVPSDPIRGLCHRDARLSTYRLMPNRPPTQPERPYVGSLTIAGPATKVASWCISVVVAHHQTSGLRMPPPSVAQTYLVSAVISSLLDHDQAPHRRFRERPSDAGAVADSFGHATSEVVVAAYSGTSETADRSAFGNSIVLRYSTLVYKSSTLDHGCRGHDDCPRSPTGFRTSPSARIAASHDRRRGSAPCDRRSRAPRLPGRPER